MISVLAIFAAADPSWLAFDRCDELVDTRLVRALVALDAPKTVSDVLSVRCDAGGRAVIVTGEQERQVALHQVSESLQPQMLALMIVDTVRTRLVLPIEGSASQPVVPTSIAQLLQQRDRRYGRLTGGLTLAFVGSSLVMMAIGVGLTIFGSQQQNVELRTTGIGIGISSPFLFGAGVVTFALWLHDRTTNGNE